MSNWTHSLVAALLITLLASLPLQNASGEDNGLERTPVLGWSSWSFMRKHPTADKMKAQALALHNSGLQELGYQYINLDDFWYQCPGPQGPKVDAYGRWITDPAKFPPQADSDGIKVVADYVHSLGMKFGTYVTPGISKQAVSRNTPIKGTSYTAAQIAQPSVKENNYNCKGMVRIDYSKPGAQEYTNSWLEMLALWGVDYIKIDGGFIRGIASSSLDQLVVEAIVTIAQGLGKKTVAEFVAEQETARLLREIGVDCAQGYFVGEPRPIAEILSTA